MTTLSHLLRPTAFRIRDFRSIKDSGICELSADAITVLAGQNESGKTSVLSALRDFDLGEGEKPVTPEFLPEGADNPQPSASVRFSYNPADFLKALQKDEDDIAHFPPAVLKYLGEHNDIWVTRDFLTGKFRLAPEVQDLWASTPSADSAEEVKGPEIATIEVDNPAAKAAVALRNYWPLFVHFDSFSDILPREISVSVLSGPVGDIPNTVDDFLTLAGVDPKRVIELESQEKQLGNYLEGRSKTITSDFLSYWRQRTGDNRAVELRGRSHRDAQGTQKLAFYVRDQGDQFPEQRSKGFLWFLSFFLRLAAAKVREPHTMFLLIDEPGSYLHARAQRDILDLFEKRIAQGHQVVYTTHSPYLLPGDKLHRVRVVIKDGEHGTRVLDRLTHPAIRGDEFADTLSPILTSLGLDVREALAFVKPLNVVVEGITDHWYLTRWTADLDPHLAASVNVFPATGAPTIPHFASLFIGWGLPFAVLLDRDQEGETTKDKLDRELGVPLDLIVQPRNAVTIEDLFSAEDFRALLRELDPSLMLNSGERPSKAIDRQRIDKVLLARKFSELHTQGLTLTATTITAIQGLLRDIGSAIRKAAEIKTS